MTTRRQFALSAAGLILNAGTLPAQDAEPTFKTGTKVVNLLATVLDKQGQILRDLAKEDFQILENGRPQTIRYFSRQSDLPLTLGLMVDTSMSQVSVMDAERAASFRFLDRVLRADKDQVFVMQFDMAVQLAQPLTASMEKLRTSLRFVDTPTRNQLRAQYGGGTLLFDAVVNASKDIMKDVTGRKALIILSDGGENGSDASLQESIDAAHKADTLIYSILFGGTEGRGILQRMSRETGGGFFEVTKRQSIDQIYDLIQEELRSQYSLGFVSDVPVRISEFRKLQLTTKQKGLTLQARDRYWAQR
ncbi:MAG: VWA domain-containing protein [Acidobacteriota bacterium]|nr:VWA domain-containing protein [Acidobacteriota bacterium]